MSSVYKYNIAYRREVVNYIFIIKNPGREPGAKRKYKMPMLFFVDVEVFSFCVELLNYLFIHNIKDNLFKFFIFKFF